MSIFRRQTFVAASCLIALVCFQPLFLLAQKPSSPSDLKKYEEAENLFREAQAVPGSATADQRRTAVQVFMLAAEIFHSTGSLVEEGQSLDAAADIQDDVG
ncbi:MAG: hypothetical protein DMF63_00625 [Acidobacteria bacterium]|nr:MAG: hypothetical protein DMF63_00625 [Acidobacteriota bacterium]